MLGSPELLCKKSSYPPERPWEDTMWTGRDRQITVVVSSHEDLGVVSQQFKKITNFFFSWQLCHLGWTQLGNSRSGSFSWLHWTGGLVGVGSAGPLALSVLSQSSWECKSRSCSVLVRPGTGPISLPLEGVVYWGHPMWAAVPEPEPFKLSRVYKSPGIRWKEGSDSMGPGSGQRICISNKLLRDAAGSWTTLWGSRG